MLRFNFFNLYGGGQFLDHEGTLIAQSNHWSSATTLTNLLKLESVRGAVICKPMIYTTQPQSPHVMM